MNIRREYEGLWVLTRIVDDSDPSWDEAVTIMYTLSGLREKFDLADAIRNGWKLLSPSECEKHFAKGVRDECEYQKATA
jgi:hypothetical protein